MNDHPIRISAWVLIRMLFFIVFIPFLPVAFITIVLVVRTCLEDRTLQSELAGYLDYTRRVRYRLLPGIW